MKNVLIPLTPVPSLFGDDAAAPEWGDGIGEVLATCIHRYNRLEVADAIGPVSLRRTTMRKLPTMLHERTDPLVQAQQTPRLDRLSDWLLTRTAVSYFRFQRQAGTIPSPGRRREPP